MVQKKKPKNGLLSTDATVAINRRARFDYILEDSFVAGMELTGTEVKSLRHGQCSIQEAYIGPKGSEIWLYNATIPEYQQAGPQQQHAPQRPRRLLLHKKEIHKLMGTINREGYTIIPTKVYFNSRGMAKLEFALGKGKKTIDKRDTIQKRDWDRQKERVMKYTNRGK